MASFNNRIIQQSPVGSLSDIPCDPCFCVGYRCYKHLVILIQLLVLNKQVNPQLKTYVYFCVFRNKYGHHLSLNVFATRPIEIDQQLLLLEAKINIFSSNKAAQWSRAKAELFWGPFNHSDVDMNQMSVFS